MLQHVKSAIRKQGLLSRGDHIMVAVSGGADSVALLCVLHRLASSLGVRLTVVHLNHGIRKNAAEKDGEFVRELANELKLPCVIGRSNVPQTSRRKRISLEMAAREARHAFFRRTARKLKATAVATAHTMDDQAETVLLKLTRGAGASGLGGMRPVTTIRGIRIVRPLLGVSRAEIVRFLESSSRSWREDASNRDPAFLRNRVRHEILPAIETRLNSNIRSVLARTARILQEESAWMDPLVAELLKSCSTQARAEGKGRGLSVPILADLAIPLQRRVVRLWLVSRGVPAEALDLGLSDRIEALVNRKKGSGEAPLPGGWSVRRCYKELILEQAGSDDIDTAFRERIRVPGETVLSGQGLRIVTLVKPGLHKARGLAVGEMPTRASLDRACLGRRALFVRSWRSGDRMRPLGLRGSKKLQDIFINAKVPAGHRARVPLFECGGDIVWIPGYRVARGWEVKDSDQPALQILVERI